MLSPDAVVTELTSRIQEVTRERDELRRLYLDALLQIKKLERGILGQRAEKLTGNDAQLTLQILAALLPDSVPPQHGDATGQSARAQRRTRGRSVSRPAGNDRLSRSRAFGSRSFRRTSSRRDSMPSSGSARMSPRSSSGGRSRSSSFRW